MRPILTILVSALLVTGCSKPVSEEPKLVTKYMLDRGRKGEIPPFEVNASPGSPLIIMVWSSDCVDCTAQLANLNSLAMRGKHRVIALDVDVMKTANAPDKLTPFLTTNRFNAIKPVVVPESSVDPVSRAYHGLDEPVAGRIYFYDQQVHELWKMTGTADFQSSEIQKLLSEGG